MITMLDVFYPVMCGAVGAIFGLWLGRRIFFFMERREQRIIAARREERLRTMRGEISKFRDHGEL